MDSITSCRQNPKPSWYGQVSGPSLMLRLTSAKIHQPSATGLVELTTDNKTQLWIPEGFAHGFLTLSDVAESRKASGFWNKTVREPSAGMIPAGHQLPCSN